jgi:hypothetical protein
MRLEQLKEEQYFTRTDYKPGLAIGILRGRPCYIEDGKWGSFITKNSTAWEHRDFAYTTKAGTPTTTKKPKPKEPTMKREEITTIVATNSVVKQFKSEDDALEWIAAELENSPRDQFTK